MVNNDVSARKVEKVAAGMSIDRMSSSQISRICKMTNAKVTDLQKHDFPEVVCPHTWLNATYIKRRDGAGLLTRAGDDHNIRCLFL